MSAGVVDLELASAFIPDQATTTSASSGNRPRNDNPKRKGRWLTHDSEIKRMREHKAKQEALVEEKKKREQQREAKKQAKEAKIAESKVIREQNNAQKVKIKSAQEQAMKVAREQNNAQKVKVKEAQEQAMKGSLTETGQCRTCRKRRLEEHTSVCLVCGNRFHKQCALPPIDSSVTVCPEFRIK